MDKKEAYRAIITAAKEKLLGDYNQRIDELIAAAPEDRALIIAVEKMVKTTCE